MTSFNQKFFRKNTGRLWDWIFEEEGSEMGKRMTVIIFSAILCCATALFLPGVANATEFNVSDTTGLQAALITAADNGDDDTINIAAGMYAVTSELTFNSTENFSLDILGAGMGTTSFDGGGSTRIMNLSSLGPTGSLTVRDITFQNGSTAESGAGLTIISDDGTVTVDMCEFNDNTVTGNDSVGGGVNLTNEGGTISITACQVRRNFSAGNVGGLFAGTTEGIITLTDSVFELNSVDQAGGGEYFGDGGGAMLYTSDTGNVTVTGNTFLSNSADGGGNPDGGGLMTYLNGDGVYLLLQNNTFTNNVAGLDAGGCIVRINNIGDVDFLDNTFTGNTAETAWGAGAMIYHNDGNHTVQRNTFTSNIAGDDGGGAWIFLGAGTGDVSGNTFTLNESGMNGGGLTYVTETAAISCTRNVFDTNTAVNVGGGLSYATNTGSGDLSNNTFYSNTATSDGGGLYVYLDIDTAPVVIRNLILWQDSAPEFGYSMGSGTLTLAVTYSDIFGSSPEPWFGTGCIDSDPLFEDAGGDDFHLTELSPCINTGDPGSPDDPDGTQADMGALVYTDCINHGDVNLSGDLTAEDAQLAFQIALGLLDPTPQEFCAADCNADLAVTAGDAQAIFGAVLGMGSCAEPL